MCWTVVSNADVPIWAAPARAVEGGLYCADPAFHLNPLRPPADRARDMGQQPVRPRCLSIQFLSPLSYEGQYTRRRSSLIYPQR